MGRSNFGVVLPTEKHCESICGTLRSKKTVTAAAGLWQQAAILQTGRYHIALSHPRDNSAPLCDAACRQNSFTTCCILVVTIASDACPQEVKKAESTATWSTDVFQQAENTVHGGVSEDDDIVHSEKHVEHIQHRSHVLLPRLIYFLISRVLYLHRTQGTKQRLPAAPDIRRARLDKFTD